MRASSEALLSKTSCWRLAPDCLVRSAWLTVWAPISIPFASISSTWSAVTFTEEPTKPETMYATALKWCERSTG